jgi:hypothetical protein
MSSSDGARLRRYLFDRRRSGPIGRDARSNVSSVTMLAANDASIASKTSTGASANAPSIESTPASPASPFPFGARRSCFEPFEARRAHRDPIGPAP